MAYAISLLERFGLYAPKAHVDEAFDSRLTRIQTRETRRDVRFSPFVRSQA